MNGVLLSLLLTATLYASARVILIHNEIVKKRNRKKNGVRLAILAILKTKHIPQRDPGTFFIWYDIEKSGSVQRYLGILD
jgi:hypothetical protein